MNVKPLWGKVLAEVLPAGIEHRNTLGLKLVDQKKHFQHALRKGKILAVGDGVKEVSVGNIVYFAGDSGRTLDHDPLNPDKVFGEGVRFLSEKECLLVEEESDASLLSV